MYNICKIYMYTYYAGSKISYFTKIENVIGCKVIKA